MKPTERAETDGGTPSPTSRFTASADSTMTRRERWGVVYDRWIASPTRVLRNDWRAIVGFLIVGVYALMGVVAAISGWRFVPELVAEPIANQGPRLQQPSLTQLSFPLGTDGLGQDLFALMIHATPSMLLMIVSGAVFSTVLATLVGVLSGYSGGNVDLGLMTITDVAMTIPGLPLLIVLAAALEPTHPVTVGILLSVTAWAGLARAIRSQVLTLRDADYVEASRTMGIRKRDIMLADVTPNLMPFILINFVGHARGIIFSSVGLYFLGVLPFTNLNWGVVLNASYRSGAMQSSQAVHWLLVPMITIIGLSFGLLLLSQALDRVFNPRVRAKHMKTAGGDGDEPETNDRNARSNMTQMGPEA
ncbi:ABC transporter permease [Haloferacaceae archaeon DSL9]